MSAQTLSPQHAGLLSGRQMVLFTTVALHGLVIAALMAMRISPDISVPDFHATLDLTPEYQPPEPKPQLPVDNHAPKLDIPQISSPIPQIPDDPIVILASPTPGPVLATAEAGTAETGTGAVAQVPSTALQYRVVRAADEYYPSQSLSLQEEGTAIVKVCVAPSGRIDGKPVIETTSGSARLDSAALVWAREALRFTPATQGGVPIGACKGFRVNFTLH